MDNAKDNIVTLYVQFDDPPALHSNQDVLGGHLLGVSFCDTREAKPGRRCPRVPRICTNRC